MRKLARLVFRRGLAAPRLLSCLALQLFALGLGGAAGADELSCATDVSGTFFRQQY